MPGRRSARLAADADGMAIGTCMLVLPLFNPVHVAEEAATLVLLDLDSERLQRSAAAAGKAASTLVMDVTDEGAVDKAFARIAADHGRIDVLVNNVGGSRNAKLWAVATIIPFILLGIWESGKGAMLQEAQQAYKAISSPNNSGAQKAN